MRCQREGSCDSILAAYSVLYLCGDCDGVLLCVDQINVVPSQVEPRKQEREEMLKSNRTTVPQEADKKTSESSRHLVVACCLES